MYLGLLCISYQRIDLDFFASEQVFLCEYISTICVDCFRLSKTSNLSLCRLLCAATLQSLLTVLTVTSSHAFGPVLLCLCLRPLTDIFACIYRPQQHTQPFSHPTYYEPVELINVFNRDNFTYFLHIYTCNYIQC